MNQRILIGGIGNIFLGDDAFGTEVVRRLAALPWPTNVTLRDFGIRGIDLVYALLDDFEHAILIDAAPRGGPPGTLYVIEPDLNPNRSAEPATLTMEMHHLDPLRVLRLAQSLGGQLRGITVVGCEPTTVDPEDMQDGLSPAVAAAVDPALELVQRLVAQRLRGGEPSERLQESI